jgi:putative ABC transport system permease protein
MTLAIINSAAPTRALVREAWGNLLALRQRSALALLGIVIGTASVVAMLSIGQMAGREAIKPFLAMGVDRLTIHATMDGMARTLPLLKVQALPKLVPGVASATGYTVAIDTQAADPSTPPVTVLAAEPNLAVMAGLQLKQGRWLADVDAESLVAVIGDKVAYPDASTVAPVRLGDQVRAGSYLYQVVGILRPTPQNSLSPADFDRSVLIPLQSARRFAGTSDPTGALVRISADGDEQAIATAIRMQLSSGQAGDLITIQNARQAIAAVMAQRIVQARLMATLGSIALLVGGLGVMNVMLMSLMERRQEIGLRAALGATPKDIHLMFLVEAVLLGAVGGLLGTGLGVACSYVAAKASHWPFSLALYTLPIGAGVAIVVALIFGLYPAMKAARLDPIEALRAE